PLRSVEGFGSQLLHLAGARGRVVVDTYVAGDGRQGRRTSNTPTPALHSACGGGEWRDESAPRALFAWLQARIGTRAGWSQAGFAALPNLLLPSGEAA
ncbi:MAG: hypothetical protein ACRC1H_18660, partial [Caldilineaceae bacterium]